ncbi:MAG: tetratricopeptide repeat protein, partial [Rhizomicrobium sp.]
MELSGGNYDLVWRAHRDCGWSLGLLGDYDSAERQYRSCIDVGEDFGAVEAQLRGRVGLTRIARVRGNLPLAERLGAELVEWAVAEGRQDLESEARHELAVTLGVRGRHAEALKQLSRAIPGPTQRDTDRLYHDIAFAHLQMGNLAIARDIFLEFTRMSDNQHVALISRVNLIQVFAALGDRAEVESQRQTLEAEGLPNDLATDFFMTLGRAYLSLGEPEDALPCFERASAIAERA